MSDVVRVGNMSGFYGDRLSAMNEQLTGGELDYLTGDYLAELTMLILGRDLMQDPNRGYAKTFLKQMRENMALAKDKGVKIVSNAGGLNPAGLRQALEELAVELDVDVKIGHVEGDDLRERAAEFEFGNALTANAYLGAWGIVECLNAGADIVVTGRVTDASVIVAPAAAHFGWRRDDYDALAGAVAAGHVIECGPQATGGNFSFFTEIADLRRPGFPIAEISSDGSSVITKHPGTGGVVTVDTVKAQLLYEIAGPRYANPDVTTRFDSLQLSEDGKDRVKISGVRGEAPPPELKVCLNTLGGFRNEVTFVLTGLDIDAKAALVKDQLNAVLADSPPSEIKWRLARTDREDADTEQTASALLQCVVKDQDPNVVGKKFTGPAFELALASYPGWHPTAPPGQASPYGLYTAAFVDAKQVPHVAVLPDCSKVDIAPADDTRTLSDVDDPASPEPVSGATKRVPLGTIVGARSGDKGGDANVGVWARSEKAWRWLANTLTTDQFQRLLPETADLTVHRYLLPNLYALNFVVEGILGQGVASQARFDPQAKALGEWLRSRHIDIPEELL